MSFFKLSIIGIALIGVAQGASAAAGDNCTVADGYLAMSCFIRMQDFGSKMAHLDVEDKSAMKEFKRTCDTLDNCFHSIEHCRRIVDDEVKRAFAMIKTYCGTVNYVANEFASCSDKIDKNESVCYEEWDPFLSDEERKDKKKVEESCKNFFGKDMCLKTEIVKHCSQKDWEGFRDHFLKLDKEIMKQCDFKNIV